MTILIGIEINKEYILRWYSDGSMYQTFPGKKTIRLN